MDILFFYLFYHGRDSILALLKELNTNRYTINRENNMYFNKDKQPAMVSQPTGQQCFEMLFKKI